MVLGIFCISLAYEMKANYVLYSWKKSPQAQRLFVLSAQRGMRRLRPRLKQQRKQRKRPHAPKSSLKWCPRRKKPIWRFLGSWQCTQVAVASTSWITHRTNRNDVTLGNKDRHPSSTCLPWMCSPIYLASFRQQLYGQMTRYITWFRESCPHDKNGWHNTDRSDPFVKKLGGSGEVDTCGEETRGLRGDVLKLW